MQKMNEDEYGYPVDSVEKFMMEDQIVSNELQVNGKQLTTPLTWFERINYLRYLRNTYLLWHPLNPLTMLNYEPKIALAGEFVGCDVNPKHPDNFSAQLYEKICEKIHA